ncbi:MAG TPA: hypothetical protein VLM05_03800, partial [Mycobacteriales bacterium]|nr:hypothetical protein [Mycobacteriales bacterium]
AGACVSAAMSVLAAYRLRVLLTLLAGLAVVAVVVAAALILVEAMTGAAPGTSGDYGAVY